MSEPAPTGRPSKFTPEVQARAIALVGQGNFLTVAARASGISYKTLKGWMKRGRSEAPADAEYRAFRELVLHARAAAESESLAKVRDSDDWRAAAWFLERSLRERWGPVSEVKGEVSGPDGGPPVVGSRRPDLSELARRAALQGSAASRTGRRLRA